MPAHSPTLTKNDHSTTVRAGDYTRFLCIQLAPPHARPALLAVSAFNIALAEIAEQVSEAMLGHIRLAWWREALAEIEAGAVPRQHPVVVALAGLYATHPDIFPLLHHMVAARAADLDPALLETEEAWQRYLDHTAGALHLIWAMLLDPALSDATRDRVVREARAYATAGLLRAIPYHTQQAVVRFSVERLHNAGLTQLTPSAALNIRVLEWAAEVSPLLGHERWPHALRPMAGLAAAARLNLKKLSVSAGNPYIVRPYILALVWQVWCAR